jgi:hypothetical protein
MKNKKLLVVYNTCGIKRDNTDWYIECINSLLNQDFDDYRVVLSSCLNSPKCFKKIYDTFGDKISYCYHSEPHTVKTTFKKTVQECVKEFGNFEVYLYVDSGVIADHPDVIKKAYDLYKSGPYAFVSVQVDTDTGFDQIGLQHEASDPAQVKNKDMVIPVGSACNLHSQIFSHEAYEAYNQKLMPDVFKAYCTESTFSFLCAALKKKWVILKDVVVSHKKGVDGASASVPHWSPVHKNPWNNLFCNRNALDFINDPEAIEAGLGYEECNKIMLHDPAKYDDNGYSKNPQKLVEMINKYFFLTKQELNYDKIKCKFIP